MGNLSGAIRCCTGINVYGGTTATIDLNGPSTGDASADPSGQVIVMSISNDPAFILADGEQWYKKIVVSASIPVRA